MKLLLNKEHLLLLLNTQVETNQAYLGENWFEKMPSVGIRNSIYREWAELLDETERDWHFYKSSPAFNRTDAIYELVDVVHFALCSLVVPAYNLGLEYEDLMLDYVVRDNYKEPFAYTAENMEFFFTEFMYHNTLETLNAFITVACEYFELDVDTYMKAHMRKNQRNRARAAGGVIQGEYDKSLEQPLTLEF